MRAKDNHNQAMTVNLGTNYDFKSPSLFTEINHWYTSIKDAIMQVPLDIPDYTP